MPHPRPEADYAKRLTRRDGSLMTLAQSKRSAELHADHNQWEENRMLTSGVMRVREVDLDFETEEENRVVLLVHDTKPPFLDGRVVFTKQAEPVMPVKVRGGGGQLEAVGSLTHQLDPPPRRVLLKANACVYFNSFESVYIIYVSISKSKYFFVFSN